MEFTEFDAMAGFVPVRTKQTPYGEATAYKKVEERTLYEVTGNITDINTLLIDRSRMERALASESTSIPNGLSPESIARFIATRGVANNLQSSTPSEAEMVCFEAYQVVGSLLSDLGMVNTEKAKKILDNLGSCRRVHSDVLPWPAFDYKPQRLTIEEIVSITDELDVKSNGFVLRIARAVEDAVAARLGVTLIDSRDLQKSAQPRYAAPPEFNTPEYIASVQEAVREGRITFAPGWNKPRFDPESRLGWMCQSDFVYEIGEASGGVEVFASVEDLKKGKPCWESCGYVQVEVRNLTSLMHLYPDQVGDE